MKVIPGCEVKGAWMMSQGVSKRKMDIPDMRISISEGKPLTHNVSTCSLLEARLNGYRKYGESTELRIGKLEIPGNCLVCENGVHHVSQ